MNATVRFLDGGQLHVECRFQEPQTGLGTKLLREAVESAALSGKSVAYVSVSKSMSGLLTGIQALEEDFPPSFTVYAWTAEEARLNVPVEDVVYYDRADAVWGSAERALADLSQRARSQTFILGMQVSHD